MFDKSFASCSMSKFWAASNDVTPRQVPKYARFKYDFLCPYCSKLYSAVLGNVSTGHWYPCRIYKTEILLFEFLNKTYPNLTIERQKKFDWCKNKRRLPFDFCINSLHLLIELDGTQHFVQVSNWTSLEARQERDAYKTKCAVENGYTVIRLLQTDVFKDKNDWDINLKARIQQHIDCVRT